MDALVSLFNLEELSATAVAVLPRLLGALGIFIIFWLAYRLIRRPTKRLLGRARFEEALARMLVENVLRFTLLLFGLITALGYLGVNVTAALAGIGVVGIALGLAAQESLSNFIAGFLIFWDKPFRVGDWVTINDLYGRVVEITMRSTRIRTKENTYIIIPNQKIINEVLTNHTKNGDVRINIPIGIAFKESVPQAREVLLETVQAAPMVKSEPAPDVVVKQVGESSIDLLVRVWIADAGDEVEAFHALLESCKAALDAAGIRIPFPHRQLYIDAVDETIWEQAHRLRKGRE